MAINVKWQRWTQATYIKSIRADAATAGLPMVFTFGPKPPPSWETATTKAETTVSGPRFKRLSPRLYLAFVDVFVVVTSNISANNYVHLDAVGAMQEALNKCFLVKDWDATGLVDIAELKARKGGDEELIDTTHLRPATEDTQIHSTLLARYEGLFRG